jgi:hypothetical protein
MKYITFELENGDLYGLPLEEVARVRAEYYAANDPDTTFQEEFDYVMNDSYEGIDWFRNNQDPEDFRGKYVLIQAGKPDSLWYRIANCESVGIREIKT